VVDARAWQAGLSWHRTMLFEGAQGVLLDRDHGFFPYISPGDCTLRAAAALAAELDISLFRLGVLRAYAIRHGPGPLPGELRPRPRWAGEAHNTEGPWQGAVRVSYPDLVLTRYALHCVGGVDALALTHADRVTPEWAFVDAYELDGERIETLPNSSALSLEERAVQTERLFHAVPLTTELRLNPDDPGEDFAERLSIELDTSVALVSRGPTHGHVQGQV
jgi:adenylosuccinate synthase